MVRQPQIEIKKEEFVMKDNNSCTKLRVSREIFLEFRNCINDGSSSTAIAIQVEIANHSKVLYSKDVVLSVREKATKVVR